MEHRTASLGLAAFALLWSIAAAAGQTSDAKAAQASGEAWLALVDGQRYAESWDGASAGFRNAITKDRWRTALNGVRTPLGSMKSRAVKSTTATTSVPGAPDGQYVIFDFATVFENKAAAAERLTLVQETDGGWRVAGYFIK